LIERLEYPQVDYICLVEALLAITNQLAALEAGFPVRKEDGGFNLPEGS
jgi:hypothetical protein